MTQSQDDSYDSFYDDVVNMMNDIIVNISISLIQTLLIFCNSVLFFFSFVPFLFFSFIFFLNFFNTKTRKKTCPFLIIPFVKGIVNEITSKINNTIRIKKSRNNYIFGGDEVIVALKDRYLA